MASLNLLCQGTQTAGVEWNDHGAHNEKFHEQIQNQLDAPGNNQSGLGKTEEYGAQQDTIVADGCVPTQSSESKYNYIPVAADDRLAV